MLSKLKKVVSIIKGFFRVRRTLNYDQIYLELERESEEFITRYVKS